MPILDVRTLGTPDIRLYEESIYADFPSARARDLFLYVLFHPRGVTQDHLRDVLFASSTNWSGLFRRTLTRVREATPDDTDDLLLHDAKRVQLNPQLTLRCDAFRFDEHLSACPVHASNHDLTCATCREGVEAAADWYGGDFLMGYEPTDESQFIWWIDRQRDTYLAKALGMFDYLAAYNLHLGDYARAIHFAREGLEHSACNTVLYGHLISAYQRLGEKRRATRIITAYRERCSDGSDPPAWLTDESWLPAIPHNVTEPPHQLVGRQTELAHIRAFLDDPDRPLLTVTGLGGVGKTLLAHHLAWELVHDPLCPFSDGVFFLDLAGVISADEMLSILRQTLTLEASSEREILLELKDKHLLLVLDRGDHLMGSRRQHHFLQRVATRPAIKVIVTSRVRLGSGIETIIELGGLPDYDATDLFLRQAYPVVNDEREIVTAICRQVQGLPLAIRIAASLRTEHSSEAILSEIQHTLQSHAKQPGSVLDQAMRSVFELSWNQLNSAQQTLLPQLTVFQGAFDTDVANHVIPQVGQTDHALLMARLVDASLLQVDRRPEGDRFSLHDVIRSYAAEKLTEGDQVMLQRQHASFFASRLAGESNRLSGSQQKAAFDTIEQYIIDHQAAWRWAIDHEETDLIISGFNSLYSYHVMRARYNEGYAIFEEARQSLSGHELEPAEEAAFIQILTALTNIHYLRGNFTRSQALLQEALTRSYTVTTDTVTLAKLTMRLAGIACYQGAYQDALEHIGTAEALANEVDVPDLSGNIHLFAGRIQEYRGDLAQAQSHYHEAYQLYANQSYVWGEAHAILKLGALDRQAGNLAEARRRLMHSLTLFQARSHVDAAALAWNELGLLEHAAGNLRDAASYFQASIKRAVQVNTQYQEAIARKNLMTHLLKTQNDLHQAADHGKQALTIFQRGGSKPELLDLLLSLYLHTGPDATALAVIDAHPATAWFTRQRIAAQDDLASAVLSHDPDMLLDDLLNQAPHKLEALR